jgi:D-glucosaminate-6-phosphate ammonia-lyase
MDRPDIRARLGVRPIINVSGTMTALGASIVVPEAVEAVAAVLSQFVEVDHLQRRASTAIARLCGAEAGFVTASCGAAISVCVAGAMTGTDLAAIERLPDTTGLRDEVVIQAGHMVSYGAPVEQGIRLAGAKVVPVGQATSTRGYQLHGVMTAQTAAALFVVSHHTVQYGMLGLAAFAAVAHEHGVPVVVDAASEYDLVGFLAAGADLVCYSAHKFLGGPTAGIVAGRKDLVRAAFLQNRGIGRGMKVGKEGIAGTIAALEAWERRDHAAVRRRETAALHLWRDVLAGRAGIVATIVPDPTANPLDRLQVSLVPEQARMTAWDLADRLASGPTPVIVRDHEIEHGFFLMDPCNLHPGEAEIVATRLREELDRAATSNAVIATSLAERTTRRVQALLAWPD